MQTIQNVGDMSAVTEKPPPQGVPLRERCQLQYEAEKLGLDVDVYMKFAVDQSPNVLMAPVQRSRDWFSYRSFSVLVLFQSNATGPVSNPLNAQGVLLSCMLLNLFALVVVHRISLRKAR